MTRSVLQFRPTQRDQGKTLTCRAENTKIPGSAAEDKWKLNVHRKRLLLLAYRTSSSYTITFGLRKSLQKLDSK